jgi:aminomethyltransferase
MALNDRGGIEDDIIVWWLEDERFWVMPNGTNSTEIFERFRADAPDGVAVSDVRSSTTLLAVQGPDAPSIVSAVLDQMPGRFRVTGMSFGDVPGWAAGTGYTGERGAELCVPNEVAAELWNALVDAGATPCGLGSRDTLRLEMGYPLWGQDLDESTTPLEAGLGWVVAWDHAFIGRKALEDQRGNLERKLIAFTTEGRAIPRHGYVVTTTNGSGSVTSGNFSPSLQHGIGLAYVSPPPTADDTIAIEIRGKQIPATRATLPFIER